MLSNVNEKGKVWKGGGDKCHTSIPSLEGGNVNVRQIFGWMCAEAREAWMAMWMFGKVFVSFSLLIRKNLYK